MRAEAVPPDAAFLQAHGWGGAAQSNLAGDASARRYLRLRRGGDSAVLMIATPGDASLPAFAAMAAWLRGAGLSAPEVLGADMEAGLMLLEDLGDDLMARRLAARPDEAASLTRDCADLLCALHQAPPPPGLPNLADQMPAAIDLAYSWYRAGATGDPAPEAQQACTALLAEAVATLRPSRVVVLRDFHAENIVLLPGRQGIARLGLLDFQDALKGHPAYDLASLVTDARRDVSPEAAEAAIARYIARTATEPSAFRAALALCAAQRNLRILGIFARLALRDRKPRYLDFLPRVWRHLDTALSHPSLAALAAQVRADMPPPEPAIIARLRRGAA